MSKRILIIGTVLLVVVLGLVGGYFVFSNRSADTEFPSLTDSGSPLTTAQKFDEDQETYEDASGYSFSYPQSITVKDVTPDDENYYSALELSKSGQTIKIDITGGNIDPYKSYKSARLTGSTTLGGITANQYTLNNRLVTVAIDQGVLYVIDGPGDGGFWEDAQSKVISSFKFAGQTTTTGGSDSNTVYEEETVE